MRILLAFVISFFFITACSRKTQQGTGVANPAPRALGPVDSSEIGFPLQTKDMGKVIAGSMVYNDFVFYNSGSGPLKVTDVKTSCSCTVPNWTLTEIMPGDSGVIKVAFDTKGYAGHFDKWITVYATGKRPTAVLYLVGEIVYK